MYVHVPKAPSPRKRAMSVMFLFPSSFSLFLDGQSIVVMERGKRGSADHFPTEAESDVGQVPLVVSSGLGTCTSSDFRSSAAKSILSSIGGSSGIWLTPYYPPPVRNPGPAGIRARARFLENDELGPGEEAFSWSSFLTAKPAEPGSLKMGILPRQEEVCILPHPSPTRQRGALLALPSLARRVRMSFFGARVIADGTPDRHVPDGRFLG